MVEVFDSGAVRDDSPYDWHNVPALGVLAIAEVAKLGAARYGRENWKGVPVHSWVDHAVSHLLHYLANPNAEDLEHAAYDIVAAIHLTRQKGLDTHQSA
jgi:hypothetical protein